MCVCERERERERMRTCVRGVGEDVSLKESEQVSFPER